MTIWPNFFIIGMDKAGTTSLYQYLNKIPGVYMSPIKEPCFFAPVSKSMRKNSLKVKNEKDYLNLFKNVKNESAIGRFRSMFLNRHTVCSPFLLCM